MNWTTTKPTKPGWYWWRDKAFVLSGSQKPIELTSDDIKRMYIFGNTCEWSSEPIPEPKEAP